MLNSMNAGVAGLQSHGKALTSVADNIANVSTMGFKATRANFGDLMVHSLTVGGSVVDQVGSGSRILNVQQMLTQGSFETTELPTDLAINGSGYFKVRNPVVLDTWGSAKYDADGKPMNMNTGPSYYTRAGQFIIDKEGYMTNPMGLRLQGYNVDKNGALSLIPEDLRLLTQQVDAIPTSEIDLTVNLNAEDLRYHPPSEPIDPADSSTYNHIVPVRTYDALGVAHDVVMFYQRLEPDSYTGPQIAGSVRTWKVTVMEKVGDEYTQDNLTQGFSGTFYLHFDDVGHLVGNTTGLPASGDAWSTSNPMPIGNLEISDRAGETFSFNTDPDNNAANNQTFRTKVDINNLVGAWNVGASVTINSKSYRQEDYPTPQELADAINSTAGNNGVFVNWDGTTMSVYTSGNTTAGVSVINAGAGNLEVVGVTTANMISAVNGEGAAGSIPDDLRTARGTITVPAFPIPANATFSIGGVSFTTTNPCADMTDLRTEIINAGFEAAAGVTFTYGENYIYVQNNTSGKDGNKAITIPNPPNNFFTATPTMTGGLDSTPNVSMSQNLATGTVSISRLDQGAGAILNVARDNTIANGKFTMKQTAYAMNQEEPYTTNSDDTGTHRKGVREISFSWLDATGAHEAQNMTIDFIPNTTSPSTQSAGSTETFYLDQDGAPRGSLESVDIGRDGLISGNFSNGTVKLLGAVLLYNFACPEEMKREGENLWSSTLAAGSEVWGRPGQGGLGKVQSGALEKSNVDLAEEMVNMINFQRAFQANSKTIQTTDTLLQELINLKR